MGGGAIKIYGIITAGYRSSNEEKRVKREKKEGRKKGRDEERRIKGGACNHSHYRADSRLVNYTVPRVVSV